MSEKLTIGSVVFGPESSVIKEALNDVRFIQTITRERAIELVALHIAHKKREMFGLAVICDDQIKEHSWQECFNDATAAINALSPFINWEK